MGRYLSTSLEMILATFLYTFEHWRIFKNMFFSWWCGNDPLTSWWLYSKVGKIPWKKVGIIPTAMVIYVVVRGISLACAYPGMSYSTLKERVERKEATVVICLTKDVSSLRIRFRSYKRRKVTRKTCKQQTTRARVDRMFPITFECSNRTWPWSNQQCATNTTQHA